MIELAPNHKYGLPISVPVMPASGAFGYGDAYQDMVDVAQLGAVVTNPVSLRPRRAARGRRIGYLESGFVVHTGWPNPGLRRLLRAYRDLWARLPVPVIVHVLATRPAEVGRIVRHLSGVRGVIGVELGFAADASQERILNLLAAAVDEGDLPVIAKVPFGRVEPLAPLLAEHGADALTLTAPPRAVLPIHEDGINDVAHYMRGRLYSATLFPLLLNELAQWVSSLPVPVIACGGIASADDALSCLTLGALAVQIDALLWRNPALLDTIARKVVEPQALPPSLHDVT
jgi:dihydroorotate dehydrogenase (NAD+) catalytic subunit